MKSSCFLFWPAGVAMKWKFRLLFRFTPERINEPRYQKEALLKLASLAAGVVAEAKTFERLPGSEIARWSYDREFALYNSAFETLEYFSPMLTTTLPHWTELPKYIKGWLAGNPIREITVVTEDGPVATLQLERT